MQTRIRYKKIDNTLESPLFESPEGSLYAVIEANGAFSILKASEELYKDLGPHTLHKAKRLVKSALIALKVQFQSEVRPRVEYNPMDDEKAKFDTDIALSCNLDDRK